ncbi:hypothetical protein [Streptomyces sp. NBC_00258]|uniref:hypothetical protein n=1 Tax=Streptomyces sp. NBC_00258 TaxID=2903642 RepID=UPI002E2B95B1|nr:hypothetical protein [Streptomyces sp. NBC_00258]
MTYPIGVRAVLSHLRRQPVRDRCQQPEELKRFAEHEGGIEHVSADNMPAATDFIADTL